MSALQGSSPDQSGSVPNTIDFAAFIRNSNNELGYYSSDNSSSNSQRGFDAWFEDPAQRQQYESEMTTYVEEPLGSYCPMCMDLDCTKTPPRSRGSRAPGLITLRGRCLRDFLETGKAGCTICALLCELFKRLYGPSIAEGKWDEMLAEIRMGFRPIVEIAFVNPMSEGQRDVQRGYLPPCYQLYTTGLMIGGSILSKTLLRGQDIAMDAGSNECIAFGRSCLERCLQDHELCREFALSSPLPTRVVYLGSNNSEIRLFEPPSRTIARFAALSYCWGKQLPITTTHDTLAERKLGLAWDNLPPVFQDAVMVARHLGVEYIWIDSLCIIQDSREDWEIESSKMASIYQSAHVTIAVGSSHSCTVPFLKPRPEHGPARAMSLEVEGHDGSSYCLKAREPAPPHDTDEEPLNMRAWTYQERILSTRILHFTTHELVWECRKGTLCECQAHDFPRTTGLPLPENTFSKASDDESIDLTPGDGDPRIGNPFIAWQRGLASYTRRKITYPSDRLPALSGIASAVHQRTKSSYIGGLWRDNLVSDLQWDTSANEHPEKRSLDPYRAPTFSWASLEVRAGYPYPLNAPSFRCDATIINADCSAAGLDPFGAVKDGFIQLEGYVFGERTISCQDVEWPGDCSIDLPRPKSWFPWYKIVINLNVPLGEEKSDGKYTARRLRSGEDFKPFHAPVWLILLGCKIDGTPVALVLGLSLRVDGAYERLGIVYLNYYNEELEFLHKHAERKIIRLV
jgi:hypothetical protein